MAYSSKYSRAYYLKHRQKCIDASRRRRKQNPGLRHGDMLRQKYGLTVEDYERMFRSQNGVCAICRRCETATRRGVLRRLSVDHNHTTNKIRGLTCQKCNSVLGYMDDDPLKLRVAAEYLERNSE